ncbi:MAG TPA: phenylalanine--tRNA ligase subunit beta [Anaerolineales bacterium]|nr:phenylalanine--tRNA ligase subunit beta [Anaerolineales bacterium]
MRVPLSWLKDFVEITLTPEELARKLTFAGLEVEEIEYVGMPMPVNAASGLHSGWKHEFKTSGIEWDREKIVVAQILEVMPHPNADRLTLLRLDWGGPREETVLTGAPNLFPFKGQGPLPKPIKVAYAKEGSVLYDGHKPGRELMALKRAKIRGVESYSMVCSEKELGISEEHEGIILLDDDALVGTPLVDYIGDVVFTVKINPNMARDANIVGVAREVAALTGKTLKPPSYDVIENGPSVLRAVTIDIREPDLNPRFTAMLIREVKIGESPYWMQRRLRLAGMRPISNVVDITNYAMIEVGQPLHAFDYDVLVKRAGDQPPTIITRLPNEGERLTTLDGVDRKLDPFTILVCDTVGALGIGGIMGGGESEVSDNTTNILLEAAAWNFINIRRSVHSQQLQSSQAGYRFSRGVHPAMAERGARRAAELMRALAGGVVDKGMVDVWAKKTEPSTVTLTEADVERILGIRIPLNEIEQILKSLEFEVERVTSYELRITTPDHRLDIGAGVVGQADVIEEIARIYGYERIPETQITDTTPPQRTNLALELEERTRDILANVGLQEVVSYRLTTPERESLVLTPGTSKDDRPYVTLANPIATDRVVMRHSLLSSGLEAAAHNLRLRDRVALYEIGAVYLASEGGQLPDEPRRLTMIMAGPRESEGWQESDRAPMDFFDLKGVIESLVDGLHLSEVVHEPGEHPSFRPGRTARLMIGGKMAGTFGELHPLVAEQTVGALKAPVLAADLDLELIIASVPPRYITSAVSRFPPVVEDIALIVAETVAASQVESLIRQAGGSILIDARLFDLYKGEQVGAGKKSLAYRLTYQVEDRTLTDAEAAKIREKIVRRAKEVLGAVLRG